MTQYYILFSPTTISDKILFQLIIAKLPSQKVYFGCNLHMYHGVFSGNL